MNRTALSKAFASICRGLDKSGIKHRVAAWRRSIASFDLKMGSVRPPSAATLLIMLIAVIVASIIFVGACTSSKAAFVKKTVSSHQIVIFSKSYCPYCRRAKAVFTELNQKPRVVELDQRGDGHNIQDALSEIVSRRTVPRVFINGKHIRGSDDTVEAYESGELAKLLSVAGDDKDDL